MNVEDASLAIQALNLATRVYEVGRRRGAVRSSPRPAPPRAGGGRDVTAQGSAAARFQRAVQTRNVFLAEVALREIRQPPLALALDYVALLAETKPEKAERAAVRWHGRLEVEATFLTLAESQLALAALTNLVAGDKEAIDILRKLVRRGRSLPSASWTS